MWLIAASLFLVALLALIAVSVDRAYAVVVKPSLTSYGLTEIFWVGALIAALIPFGFLSIYSCLLFIMCGQWVLKIISRQHPP